MSAKTHVPISRKDNMRMSSVSAGLHSRTGSDRKRRKLPMLRRNSGLRNAVVMLFLGPIFLGFIATGFLPSPCWGLPPFGVSSEKRPFSAAHSPIEPSYTVSVRQPPRQVLHPAVARIVVQDEMSTSLGSGTLVDAQNDFGLVLTNWHVIQDNPEDINVYFPGGFSSVATVVASDRDWDLAALSIPRPPADPVPVAVEAPRQGERLWIAGYGSGDYRMTSGRCLQYVAPAKSSLFSRGEMPYEMVELQASARQGDSGGPIFNDRGELAGVLFGSDGATTVGSYCHRITRFLDSHRIPRLANRRPPIILGQSPGLPRNLTRTSLDDGPSDPLTAAPLSTAPPPTLPAEGPANSRPEPLAVASTSSFGVRSDLRRSSKRPVYRPNPAYGTYPRQAPAPPYQNQPPPTRAPYGSSAPNLPAYQSQYTQGTSRPDNSRPNASYGQSGTTPYRSENGHSSYGSSSSYDHASSYGDQGYGERSSYGAEGASRESSSYSSSGDDSYGSSYDAGTSDESSYGGSSYGSSSYDRDSYGSRYQNDRSSSSYGRRSDGGSSPPGVGNTRYPYDNTSRSGPRIGEPSRGSYDENDSYSSSRGSSSYGSSYEEDSSYGDSVNSNSSYGDSSYSSDRSKSRYGESSSSYGSSSYESDDDYGDSSYGSSSYDDEDDSYYSSDYGSRGSSSRDRSSSSYGSSYGSSYDDEDDDYGYGSSGYEDDEEGGYRSSYDDYNEDDDSRYSSYDDQDDDYGYDSYGYDSYDSDEDEEYGRSSYDSYDSGRSRSSRRNRSSSRSSGNRYDSSDEDDDYGYDSYDDEDEDDYDYYGSSYYSDQDDEEDDSYSSSYDSSSDDSSYDDPSYDDEDDDYGYSYSSSDDRGYRSGEDGYESSSGRKKYGKRRNLEEGTAETSEAEASRRANQIKTIIAIIAVFFLLFHALKLMALIEER